MKIRKTKEEDIKELVKIFRIEKAKKPYSQKLTIKEASDKIKDSIKKMDTYTLEIEDTPKGFFTCQLKPDKKEIYLDELWISKRQQGRGDGKLVMKFIEKEYKKKGYKKITLVADRNATAATFYKKIGYKVTDEWLYMTKKIK